MLRSNSIKCTIIVLAAAAWFGLTRTAVAQREPFSGRNLDGYYSAPDASYVNISMPAPIKAADIDRWSCMMGLTEVQVQLFKEFYKEYVERENDIHDKYVQPVWDQSADISSRRTGPSDVAVAQEFAGLLKRIRPRALQRLVNSEEQVFNELAAHLSESQLPMLDRVRKQRQRARSNRRRARYPGGDIDLTMFLYALHKRGFDTIPSDPAVLDALLAEYDAAVTPLFKRRAQAIVRISGEGTVLLASRLSMGAVREGSERWMVAKELRAKSKQLNRKLVHVEKRILNQNVLYLNAMADVLPEREARGLVGAFQQLVYEPVYPDPTDVRHLFDAVFELPSLSIAQRADVEATGVLIDVRQGTLCDRMSRRYLEWREFQGIEWGLPAGALPAYEKDMQDLDSKRKENAELAIALITDILLPEQSDEMANTISSSLSRIRDHELIVDRRFHRR